MQAHRTGTPVLDRPTHPTPLGITRPRWPGRGADPRAVHPLTLRFRDADLERACHAARIRFRTVATRTSALAGAATWLGLLDGPTIRDPSWAPSAVRGAGRPCCRLWRPRPSRLGRAAGSERAGVGALARAESAISKMVVL